MAFLEGLKTPQKVSDFHTRKIERMQLLLMRIQLLWMNKISNTKKGQPSRETKSSNKLKVKPSKILVPNNAAVFSVQNSNYPGCKLVKWQQWRAGVACHPHRKLHFRRRFFRRKEYGSLELATFLRF
jgi:hypothetical protein